MWTQNAEGILREKQEVKDLHISRMRDGGME